MATSMRPALATAASTARATEASSVTSNSRTYIGSESFSARVPISEAFLALRPPGSRIVAKTVCPLRARVSANSLPKPVLEPVMRTTCLEFMIIPPWWRYRETSLMPEVKRLVTKMNSTDCLLGKFRRCWLCCSLLSGGTCGFGAFDLDEFSGMHVIEEAVDGNGFGHERMVANARNIVEDSLLLILDGEPLDEFTGTGSRSLAYILEPLGGQLRCFQAGSQQAAHDIAGEEFHAAIRMVNDEKFAGAEKFITDDQRANGIVAGPAAGVADDVGIAFGEAGVLGGIEARVHAGENGEAARRRESEFAFFTEAGAVLLIGFEHFRKNLAHDISPFVIELYCDLARRFWRREAESNRR